MAILPTSAERAQSNVAKAEATVSEWQAKATAARAEAAELDATAGAAILADESAAERITLQVQALERKARAYDQAAAEAGKNLLAARRAVLESAAAGEADTAAKARKQADAHDVKVEALKAKLEEFDEGPWMRTVKRDGDTTITYTGKSGALRNEALAADIRGAVIRYYMAHDKIPNGFHELNDELGTTFTTMGMPLYERRDVIHQCIRDAQAASVNAA